MAGTNDFLPFATAGGANVLSQSAYAALAAVSTGYQAGVAQSAQLNKTWRQSSIIASMVAQFIVDQTGANAVDDGTIATLEANFVAALRVAAVGRLLNTQVFATPGTSTYTPTPGTRWIEIELVGGGAAGAGTPAVAGGSSIAFGGGGSGAAYARGQFFTGFSGATVTVGAGGVGAANSAGGAGGSSSVGALITAPGGVIGTVAPVLTPGSTPTFSGGTAAPASATGGNIVSARGGFGTYGIFLSSPTSFGSGPGGASAFGSGAAPVTNVTGPGLAATSPGAGGSGALTTGGGAAQAGGNGANGIVIIKEYA